MDLCGCFMKRSMQKHYLESRDTRTARGSIVTRAALFWTQIIRNFRKMAEIIY